ncbi:hypothetical protein JRI60_30000 [Archangium violaceum]|uniref:hypothetical protein n=1 Tax=Archangium violaceum TaxID=83451 RepID=UPI0019525603|nr:hypothetical protein [Archangium violaceum]QRN93415.1 hypothetical protein JRI60_30000 [Archangium violaceum]
MAHPAPPHVQSAQAQVAAALQQLEGKPVDLLKVPWSEVEASAIKLLGGAFQVNNPNHQGLALGLAGAFAERMATEHGAFWFPNRDSPEGATLGFPDAIIMLSPFGAVMDALSQGKLGKLEDLAADIRKSLAQVKFAPGATQSLGASGPKMGPADYQRLFDPGFLQFVVLDSAKAKTAFETKPDALARDIRDALGRTQLPPEARQQFEGQIVQSLQRLDPSHALAEQMDRAPRIAELMGHMFATVGGTGAAPEEFWGEIVLPLLFIGSPQNFPPVDEDEIGAFTQGAPPLALFVDVVPHSVQAPEEGLLGTFEQSDLSLLHPGFGKVGALRLIKVNAERIKPLLANFDPNKTVDAVRRFTKYMEEKAGKGAPPNPQNEEMLKAATVLLTDLKKAVETKGEVCLRRLTEAEAASEQAVAVVRQALNGPRIILS